MEIMAKLLWAKWSQDQSINMLCANLHYVYACQQIQYQMCNEDCAPTEQSNLQFVSFQMEKDMICGKNEKGMTPLHLAAKYGRVE